MATNKTVRCAITGANGYVGACIANYLRSQGVDVVELNRRGTSKTRFVLGEDLPPGALAGVDVLVHCAYDFAARTWHEIKRVNVDGSLKLFASAHVPKIIFISSLAAFDGCKSMYGQAKLAVEKASQPNGVISIRPGLVYDQGEPRGIVGALSKITQFSPIIPLIAGSQMCYPCHAEDLARMVYQLCTRDFAACEPITAASKDGLPFREVLRRMAAKKGRNARFVPVFSSPILWSLKAVESLGLKSRIRSDSLISLLNQNPRVDFAELERMGAAFRPFDA